MNELFEMDPNFIGPDGWSFISVFVRNIWFFVVSILVFATNMLIGHNAIPSLVGSKHLPGSFQKLRIPFYAVAIVAFVAALFFVYTSIQGARNAINLIYPEFWI